MAEHTTAPDRLFAHRFPFRHAGRAVRLLRARYGYGAGATIMPLCFTTRPFGPMISNARQIQRIPDMRTGL